MGSQRPKREHDHLPQGVGTVQVRRLPWSFRFLLAFLIPAATAFALSVALFHRAEWV